MAIPLVEPLDIKDKDITGDAMLTQRKFATYLVEEKKAHYHFIVKGNQPQLQDDITHYFKTRQEPDFIDLAPLEHGRIETRKIWTTCELNGYLDFPHVGQAFAIERESIDKKTGKASTDIAYGITSRTAEEADAERILKINRGHWSIENSCHYIIDWNYDEDRSRIRIGHGPENITRLRRFSVGLIKSKGISNVAKKMRQLHRSVRLVFDYLKMTENACGLTCR